MTALSNTPGNPYVATDNDTNDVVNILDSGGRIRAVVEDRNTPPVDLFFTQAQGVPTELTADLEIGDTVINVASVANISEGDYIGIFSGVSGENRFYFAEVLSIATLAVTVDTPLDFAYESGDAVVSTTREMDVDGSSTPQIFSAFGAGGDSPVVVVITRIIIQCIADSAVDLGKFGDLTALTKGVVLRRTDGDTRNLWNVKSNGDFANISYDWTPYDAANPGQGLYGFAMRYSFSGNDKHGTSVELAAGDRLDLIIQDNISGLTQFRAMAQGYIKDI